MLVVSLKNVARCHSRVSNKSSETTRIEYDSHLVEDEFYKTMDDVKHMMCVYIETHGHACNMKCEDVIGSMKMKIKMGRRAHID